MERTIVSVEEIMICAQQKGKRELCVRRKRTNTNRRKERKEKRIFYVGTQQTYSRKTVNARERKKREKSSLFSTPSTYIYQRKETEKEKKKSGTTATQKQECCCDYLIVSLDIEHMYRQKRSSFLSLFFCFCRHRRQRRLNLLTYS